VEGVPRPSRARCDASGWRRAPWAVQEPPVRPPVAQSASEQDVNAEQLAHAMAPRRRSRCMGGPVTAPLPPQGLRGPGLALRGTEGGGQQVVQSCLIVPML
jgi:hypothetical protein